MQSSATGVVAEAGQLRVKLQLKCAVFVVLVEEKGENTWCLQTPLMGFALCLGVPPKFGAIVYRLP